MAGKRKLRKLQGGKETTAGTAIAATWLWRGPASGLDDRREVVFIEEDIGRVAPKDRTFVPRLAGGLAMEETPATYEQLPYILEAGVKAVHTGAADGVGSDKIYTYTFPTASANSLNYYTLEAGDDQQAEEMEFCFVESFELSGGEREAVAVSAEWIGRQVATTTFTSVALASVAEILFGQTKLYIDAVSGTIGTTQKSNTLLEFAFSVTTGWKIRETAEGNLYFDTANFDPGALEILLELIFEHDGTATAEKTNWRNQTARLIRLATTGPALSTAGTAYSNKTLHIDVAGKWERFEVLDERDGNDVVAGRFRVRENDTAAKFAEIVVVNELTTLT